MRVVIQRVREAAVAVDGEITGAIGLGLLVLAGFEATDGAADIDWIVGKILRTRIFAGPDGAMNLAIGEVGGAILAVSQFTLYASLKKGNRPSWSRAAPGHIAQPLFACFVEKLANGLGQPVATGIFGADMQVSLVNDGPVTLTIDSQAAE